MNENIKEILKMIEEHPDLPVVPMVGQVRYNLHL